MEFKTFISRLKAVRDIGKIENGYSHIVFDLMSDHVLASEKYMVVDVSTMKRYGSDKQPINKELLGENICAVPDFVITNKTSIMGEIKRYGCIEVKFEDKDVEVHKFNPSKNRLNPNEGNSYLEIYKHVIFTNGWKWNYYVNNQEPEWTFDFSGEECKESTYCELINSLKEVVS